MVRSAVVQPSDRCIANLCRLAISCRISGGTARGSWGGRLAQVAFDLYAFALNLLHGLDVLWGCRLRRAVWLRIRHDIFGTNFGDGRVVVGASTACPNWEVPTDYVHR